MATQAALAAIARHFFEIENLTSAVPIGAGNINDSYRIDFQANGKTQTWFLQRLNHVVFTNPAAVMHNIQRVAEQLNQQADFSLRIPAPLPGLDGQLLQRDEAGNCWRVFPFFENTYAPEALPDPAVAYEAARAYGQFLSALQNCPIDEIWETIPGFHDTQKRWVLFQQVVAENPVGRAKQVNAEIVSLKTAKSVFDEVGNLKKRGVLPLRVVHNDTKAGNVLLDIDTGKAIAVIDWDTVMPGTVLSDFGDMVRTFTADRAEDNPESPSVRPDVLDALHQGFMEQTGAFLTAQERQHLMLGAQWIVGEQALRFLTDYLAGDLYYKTEYPEHNWVRARNQLALFEAVRQHTTRFL